MQVKDIMTKKVISVKPEKKVREVAKILIEERIHGVPIVDDDNKVIGIITETDFFAKGENNLYIPSFIDFMQKSKLFRAVSLKKKIELRKILNATAKDVMTKYCITISPEADLSELLKLFRQKKLHTVPVTKKDNSLCGIVSLADIISLVKL